MYLCTQRNIKKSLTNILAHFLHGVKFRLRADNKTALSVASSPRMEILIYYAEHSKRVTSEKHDHVGIFSSLSLHQACYTQSRERHKLQRRGDVSI